MVFRINIFGYGLAAIFSVGAILLAAIGKEEWKTFALIAIFIWIISLIIKKIKP